MNRIGPPTDPGQLPPKTDDFMFCNYSNQPIPQVEFEADGHPEIMPAPVWPQIAMQHIDGPDHATSVKCRAHVGGVPIEYEYVVTQPGWWVASMICGVRDGRQGGVVPFGVVLLRGPLPHQIRAEALQFENATF